MIRSASFELSCNFELSRSEEISDIVRLFVDEANKTLLIRGSPRGREHEAGRIVSWRVEGNRLSFDIKSGTHVRAHAAVLRIRKALSELLGRERKIGIRGIEVDHYVVTLELEKEVPRDIVSRLSAVAKVLRASIDGDVVRVFFEPLSLQELKTSVPDRVLSIVQEVLLRALRPSRVSVKKLPVVRQGPPKRLPFNDDPTRVAIELGWIKEFPGRGQWIYTSPYVKLFNVIQDILISKVLQKLGFAPFLLPKLIPLEIMKRMPGYLDGIPEGMYYVCPPPRDPRAFEDFKKAFRSTRRVPVSELKRILKGPGYVLAPAQCEPFWRFFANETVDVNDLPFKLYDCSGWTYRWEGGGVEGIVRLQEFQRIELSYLGTPEQVVEIREAIVSNLERVVEETLNLEWRITVATPFYMVEEERLEEEEIPSALDIEIYLPYRGARDKSEWLEIAGCFVHRRKYVDNFKIREKRGREIWTGCTGLGLSRFVAAFLGEYGFQPKNWPREVKMRYGKVPDIPRFLLWPRGA